MHVLEVPVKPGGHNAGIVSEPGRARRSYQIAATEDGQGWTGPDEWEANAPVREGSWWEAMDAWLKERSGEPVAPPAIDPATACSRQTVPMSACPWTMRRSYPPSGS